MDRAELHYRKTFSPYGAPAPNCVPTSMTCSDLHAGRKALRKALGDLIAAVEKSGRGELDESQSAAYDVATQLVEALSSEIDRRHAAGDHAPAVGGRLTSGCPPGDLGAGSGGSVRAAAAPVPTLPRIRRPRGPCRGLPLRAVDPRTAAW